MNHLIHGVNAVLSLPRQVQPNAIESLLMKLPKADVPEVWNTAFGPESLYEAWSQTRVARGVYMANTGVLRQFLDGRPNWRVLEVGAGNGALWRRLLGPDDVGTLVLVDPVTDAHAQVAGALPPGVKLESRVGRIESLTDLPEVDAVVCSLTLHHVAGRNSEERAQHDLKGPGKREVLAAFGEAIRARDGMLLLNEADVHCEIDLPPNDPMLRDRLIDSYVRRCGRAMLDDLSVVGLEKSLAARFEHILRFWCLEQVRLADSSLVDRDVYELDVGRWREVLADAGLRVDEVRSTDAYGLFFQYRCGV
ncbi:MAG: methyltransferase domain-containing protein [Rhodobacterales bacterium]|nr:methyltransferase domain-containing protein [Rhodobacterales bacterium]